MLLQILFLKTASKNLPQSAIQRIRWYDGIAYFVNYFTILEQRFSGQEQQLIDSQVLYKVIIDRLSLQWGVY